MERAVEQKAHEPTERDREMVRKVLEYVQANYMHDLHTPVLAKISGLSTFHFHRLFTAVHGKTPKQVWDEARVEAAKNALLGDESILGIALRLGYAHQSHFTSRFKKLTGNTPDRWRRENRSSNGNSQVQAVS